jgi:hypothetical protein
MVVAITQLDRTASGSIVQQLARMDAGRLRAYRENLDFYQGRQWADPARRRERRLTLNYAKAVIEKTASYTMSGLSFVVDPEDGSEEAAARGRRAERVLEEIHEANSLDQLEFDNEIDCAVLGDAAYKVTWDAAEKRVRVSAPDVQGLFVWPWGDDASRLWRVASRYVLGHEEAEMLYGPLRPGSGQAIGSGRTRRSEHSIVEVWTDADFELWIDGAPFESRENPYGFIPFVIYPTVREPKQFWGVSDLVALKEPLRELNRAMSQLSLILELSGNPISLSGDCQFTRPRTSIRFGQAITLMSRRSRTCLLLRRTLALSHAAQSSGPSLSGSYGRRLQRS